MRNAVARLSKPAWECVHFGTEPPDAGALEDAGLYVGRVAGQSVEDGSGLIAALAAAFDFPDYFGGNWDAAEECLRDLSWLDARGFVLVVSGAEALWRRNPRPTGKLASSWLFCAEEWAGTDVPFHLVFDW